MQNFKKLLLVTSFATTAACIAEQSSISEDIRTLSAQLAKIEENTYQFNTTLKKATRRGWPFTAKLVTLGLSAFIAWEHKDEIKSRLRKKLTSFLAEKQETAQESLEPETPSSHPEPTE